MTSRVSLDEISKEAVETSAEVRGWLHRPTVAFMVMVITALVASPDFVRAVSEGQSGTVIIHGLAAQAQHTARALVATSAEEMYKYLPVAMLSVVAVTHFIFHDLLGKTREGYLRWAAFCRFAESRAIMNLMHASTLWAAITNADGPTEFASGFSGQVSHLLSVAMVVQHYAFTNPAWRAHRFLYYSSSMLLWVSVLLQCMDMAATTSTVAVLQAIFLTKSVWFGYIPAHWNSDFSAWMGNPLATRRELPVAPVVPINGVHPSFPMQV